MSDAPPSASTVWAENQKALARALGISIEEWMKALDAAATRKTGLTAAVIGAAMAKGLGMGVIQGLNGPALAKRARSLIDPEPPRAANPVLREAIRRAEGLETGEGIMRLKARREAVNTPRRGDASVGDSAPMSTPDAPGGD